jgi:hypothetical protein
MTAAGSNSASQKLIELIGQIKAKITADSDMMWGRYDTPEQLVVELEQYESRLSQEDLSCLKSLDLLFAPTGTLQEHALQNGWSTKFLVMAETFDALFERLK